MPGKLFRASLTSAVICFFLSPLIADESIESLMGSYAKRADLSERTKRESDGYLIVFTRQELDRMQIRSLREIIEKIPFIRYNESRLGFSASFYAPYQPDPPAGMRVYINDRILYTPFFGNALKLFGQLDMGYIDHVEVYYGLPSQTLGIDGAVIVIKMYTKDPERENTSLAGLVAGSYGSSELYGYTTSKDEEGSELFYLDYKNMHRKESRYKSSTLSKDRESTNFYSQIERGRHRFEVQAIGGRLDTFLGYSPHLDPLDPHLSFRYLFGGWGYKNRETGVESFLHLTRNSSSHYDASKTMLGIYPSAQGAILFSSSRLKIVQHHAEAQLKKSFASDGAESSLGVQAKTGRFSFEEAYLDGKPYDMPSRFNRQTALSLFAQGSYLIDESRIVVGSIKGDRYLMDDDMRDYSLLSGRLGYIYNGGRWLSKSFIFYGSFAPEAKSLFENRYLYRQSGDPDAERSLIVSTKITYRERKRETSLLAARYIKKDALHFDGRGYDNFEDDIVIDCILFEHIYSLPGAGRFKLDVWTNLQQPHNSLPNRNTYGAIADYSRSLGRFDLHTALVYTYGPGLKPGWDLEGALTYRPSRRVSLFVKGSNILGRALKSDYYGIDPVTGEVTRANGLDVIERRVWAGVEYQF